MAFFMGPEVPEDKIKATIAKVESFSEHIEKRLASGRAYLGGDKMTTADISVYSALKSIAFNDGTMCLPLKEGVRAVISTKPHIKDFVARMDKTFADYLQHRPKPRPI